MSLLKVRNRRTDTQTHTNAHKSEQISQEGRVDCLLPLRRTLVQTFNVCVLLFTCPNTEQNPSKPNRPERCNAMMRKEKPMK